MNIRKVGIPTFVPLTVPSRASSHPYTSAAAARAAADAPRKAHSSPRPRRARHGSMRKARQAPGVHARRIARLARIGDLPVLEAAIATARADGFVLGAVNYTSIANAHVVSGKRSSARKVLREMRGAGVHPTNGTIRVGFKAVECVGDVMELLEWFRTDAEEGAEAKTWNMGLACLTKFCNKQKQDDESRSVRARDGDVVTQENSTAEQPDVENDAAWAAMRLVFAMMNEVGARASATGESINHCGAADCNAVPAPDVYTYNAMLKACRIRGDTASAFGLFARACATRHAGVLVDTVSCNTLLGICLAGAGRNDEGAVRLMLLLRKLDRWVENGVFQPDMITRTLLLQVVTCRHRELLPSPDNAESTHDNSLLPSGGFKGAISVSRILAKPLNLGGQPRHAVGTGTDSLLSKWVPPTRSQYSLRAGRLIHGMWRSLPHERADKHYYNTLIASFARVGDTSNAVRALREMRELHHFDADLYTYNSLLSAAGRTGDVKLANRLLAGLRRNRKYGPDSFSYSAALSACRCGFVLESEKLLSAAVAEGVPVSPPMLNAALQSYGGDIAAALAQWRKWRLMDLFSSAASDLQVYRALLRVAGISGRPDQALRVLLAGKRMKELDPATAPGLFGAFARGMREGGQQDRVRGNLISNQYLGHLRLECRVFDKSLEPDLSIERVRIKW